MSAVEGQTAIRRRRGRPSAAAQREAVSPLQNAVAESGDSVLDLGGPVELGSGRPIRQEVHERLRDAILNVKLLPGSAVSENEIAAHLQVSRTPVREAMQRLSLEGMIQVVPQVGTFVARMNLERIREALFVREAVECTAMMRLPATLPQDELDALKTCVSRQRAAGRRGDVATVLECDEWFHKRLLELAGVAGAWRYVLEARELHRRVRVLAQSRPDAPQRSQEQHAAIVAELSAGRPAAAADVLREHIRMNVRFAEEIANRNPHYFTAPAPRQT